MQTHHTTRRHSTLKDETGNRYGRLAVLQLVPAPDTVKEKRQGFWLCRCDCGNTVVANGSNLRRGDTVSCGCFNRDYEAKQRKKPKRFHGLPEYDIWNHMKRRCYNPNDANYHLYGNRGITVCREWRESFEAFYVCVGPRPSPDHTIDRIDVNGNYEPCNVRWATPKEQAYNKRNNVMLTYQGRTHPLREWAREVGIHPGTAYGRYRRGLPPEDILFVGHLTPRR